jgi:hypothetical protein
MEPLGLARDTKSSSDSPSHVTAPAAAPTKALGFWPLKEESAFTRA